MWATLCYKNEAIDMYKTIANNSIKISDKAIFCLIFLVATVHAAPVVQQWQHPSGAKVAWVAAPGIPMVDVRLEFDVGNRRDPAGQAGLASAMAGMSAAGVAAQGRAPARSENELAERWIDLGAQWSVSAGADRLSAQLRTLTDPAVAQPSIALAAQILAHPAWESADAAVLQQLDALWQRDHSRLTSAWQNQQLQPATLAAQRFQSAVYGDHPYGAQPSPESWAHIQVASMRQHWRQHIQPCRARISVVGEVDQVQVERMVNQLLAPLVAVQVARGGSGTCAALPPVPEVVPLAQANRISLALDTAQAHVLMGQPGYSRRDPDFFPLLVGNHILGGGGFTSRLTTEVREKRGLSYGAYSYFSPGEHAGAFTAGLQTRPDQAAQAVAVAQDVIQQFVAEGPSDAEMQATRNFMVNGFALRIDSNAKLLDNVANMLWFDLPAHYLQTWTDQITAVTADQVRQAFQRVLQPSRMVTVVVGGKPAAP